jgi:hypothetical protein
MNGGGITTPGSVGITLPDSPRDWSLWGGISAGTASNTSTVTINGNSRANSYDETLVDSGGIYASGTITLNFASPRDGEWGYVTGDVKTAGTLTINSRQQSTNCSGCSACYFGCNQQDPGDWDFFKVTGSLYRATKGYTNLANQTGTCSAKGGIICTCSSCTTNSQTIKGGVQWTGSENGAASKPTNAAPADSNFTYPTDGTLGMIFSAPTATITAPSGPGYPPVGTNGLCDAPAASPAIPAFASQVDNVLPYATGGGDLALPGEPGVPAEPGVLPAEPTPVPAEPGVLPAEPTPVPAEPVVANNTPAIPTWGSGLAFPDMSGASADLPGWMRSSFATETVDYGSGLTGQIPITPPAPSWNGHTEPDWANLLPGGGTVKFPKPNWGWWEGEAQNQAADTWNPNPHGGTKVYHPDTGVQTLDLRYSSTNADQYYYVYGDVQITSLNFGDQNNRAYIIAYGDGTSNHPGNITVADGLQWTIGGTDRLQLIAKNNVNISPSGWGYLSIAENATYQFYAGNEIHIQLSIFNAILQTGATKGNLVAGNLVDLQSSGVPVGWYNFKYERGEIKPEGWTIPYKVRSWRELTKANWL